MVHLSNDHICTRGCVYRSGIGYLVGGSIDVEPCIPNSSTCRQVATSGAASSANPVVEPVMALPEHQSQAPLHLRN